MKKFLIILTIFGLLILLSNRIPIINATPKIFSHEDAHALGIKIDMQQNEVLKVLGQPLKIVNNGNIPTDAMIYYYKFGEIHFDPLDKKSYTVSGIIINKINYKGPRDIEVNDNVETVFKKFPYIKDLVIKDPVIIEPDRKYIYGKIGENCGFIMKDKTGAINTIIYSYGGGGFGTYSLKMDVKNNKVKDIEINVMNL